MHAFVCNTKREALSLIKNHWDDRHTIPYQLFKNKSLQIDMNGLEELGKIKKAIDSIEVKISSSRLF